MLPRRRPTRLPEYDYARPGITLVTVCLRPRVSILGRVVGGDVELTDLGAIVAEELTAVAVRHSGVGVDVFVVMPDHVHALVVVADGGCSVSRVVGSFKSVSARRVNEHRRASGAAFWQRGFHDHVVRDERDLERCRAYVATNPLRWSIARGADQ